MKRQLTVNGRSAKIEIEGSRLRYVREDGDEIESDFSVAGGSVLLNGRSYRVSKGAGKEIWVNGRLLSMEVFDPRDLRPGQGASAKHGRQEIAAIHAGKSGSRFSGGGRCGGSRTGPGCGGGDEDAE